MRKERRDPIEPPEVPRFDVLGANDEDAIACTWLGQSTCLLQLGTARVLLDPVFAAQLAPPFGPKRVHTQPAALVDLGKIDLVVISHAHFDHLDYDVVDQLGDATQWVVPLGLRRSFLQRGVTRVVELDWWEQTDVMTDDGLSLRVTGLPTMVRGHLVDQLTSQHWSARSFLDVNQSLWNSTIISTKSRSVFHCGDTGLCQSLFDAIGRHFDVDLALLPIGSYAPRWCVCAA